VIVEAASAAELQDLGARAIDELRSGEGDLELRLAPGRYEGVPIGLGTVGPAIGRLILRAADPDRPPDLSDLTIRLRAEHVGLEHLVIAATRRAMPIVALEGHRVEMRRCAMVGCHLEGPPGGRLVELIASGDGATATLEDCWFVDNHAPGHGLALIAADGYRAPFTRVELTGVAWVANDVSVTLAPRAETVWLTRCLAVAARDGADDAILLALAAPGTTATFDGCLLDWTAVAGLVAPWSDGARIRRSILACAPGPDSHIELDETTFAPPSPDPQRAILDARAAASRAARPDLRRLAAALGIELSVA
jgi:hypothetical protein